MALDSRLGPTGAVGRCVTCRRRDVGDTQEGQDAAGPGMHRRNRENEPSWGDGRKNRWRGRKRARIEVTKHQVAVANDNHAREGDAARDETARG